MGESLRRSCVRCLSRRRMTLECNTQHTVSLFSFWERRDWYHSIPIILVGMTLHFFFFRSVLLLSLCVVGELLERALCGPWLIGRVLWGWGALGAFDRFVDGVLWCWDVVSGDGCRVRHMSDGDKSCVAVNTYHVIHESIGTSLLVLE